MTNHKDIELSQGHTALLVVDVQNGFVNTKSEKILAPLGRLLDNWNGIDPVFFTKFQNLPGSNWETMIGWRRLRESPETDFHPSIVPYLTLGTVVEKANMYSSLTGEFLQTLRNSEIDNVVICGIATESCVLATALAVFEYAPRRVRPIVLSDAVASHAGDEAHQAGMLTLERFIGRNQICTVNEVLSSVRAR